MVAISVYARYSAQGALDKVATLSKEGTLVFNDEGNDLKAHVTTAGKFALLTVGSPFISIARLVRSAVFALKGELLQSKREFIGVLATPILAIVSLAGTLLSSLVYVISSGRTSYYASLRRTYAYFEAWVNQVHLNRPGLGTYSSRVSSPTDFTNRVWTTAPCMQPLLENGNAGRGGLLDVERMQRIFPFFPVDKAEMEGDKVVLQKNHYSDKDAHYIGCNGAFEHRKITNDCCCWQIEAVADRYFCCEFSKGSCTSKSNPGDSCGYVSCCVGNVGCCCCYAKDDHQVSSVNTGCCGPSAAYCFGMELRRV